MTAPTQVSIVMPLYGRADLAVRAVRRLVANTPPCFELIVVDNGSPPGALAEVRREVPWATFVENRLNVGFSAAVDVGVMTSRHPLVVLLNSDAFVEPGWLPPLVAALDDERVAAAAPMFRGDDGAVQEAGSVLFASGATAAVEAGERWSVDFARSVPYVSAACLVIRRAVFCALGGFDVVYGRGYYEDVELALELEAHDLLIAYVPASQVRHVRGASSRPGEAEALGRRNHEIFKRRWAKRLTAMPPSEPWLGAATILRARDALAVDRILVVDDRVPHVDRGSGDPRMATFATRLAALWPQARVTLFAADPGGADRYAPALLAAGVEVAAAFDTDAPRWFEERTGHYSAVIVSRPHNYVRYRELVDRTQPQALRVVDVEAIFSRRTDRQAALVGATDPNGRRALSAESGRQRAIEFESWNWADLVVCVSAEEAAEVALAAPTVGRVVVSAAVAPPASPPGFDERDGAVFFGGFMAGETSPNVDSVHEIVSGVMPLLWHRHPQLHLTIAGADPTASVRAVAERRVRVIGRVPRPVDVLGNHRVHLAPVRFGAGIKLKLIESMACGLPFVTTACGAEGLHLDDVVGLRDLLVADDHQEQAALADALLADGDRWSEAQAGLLAVARRWFSPGAFDEALIDLGAHLGMAPPTFVPRWTS